MFKNLFILVFIASFLVISCNDMPDISKEANTNKKKIKSIKDAFLTSSTEYNGILQACSNKNLTGNVQSSYGLSCEIFASPAGYWRLDGGTATISDVTPVYPNGNNYNIYGYIPQILSQGMTAPTLGEVTQWALSGNEQNEIPAFSDSMYVPTEIYITSSFTDRLLSKSENTVLTWNSDQNNDSIAIFISYNYSLSNYFDTSMVDSEITFFQTTPDDGSFTITSGMLEAFPVDGIIDFYIGRGNAKNVSVENMNFLLLGYTTVSLRLKIDD